MISASFTYDGGHFVNRYAPKGATEAELRALPVMGYRHWAEADELMAAEFGDASYLMALELRTWDGGPRATLPMAEEYPPIKTMGKARDLRRMTATTLEGGHQAYVEIATSHSLSARWTDDGGHFVQ